MHKTTLYSSHELLKAKLADFAGYKMPITYPSGHIHEHEWVRSHAGIFDVSHMGQALLEGPNIKEFVSHITPTNFLHIENSQAKYTVLTTPEGGIIDDLIITCINENTFFVVYNAGCKEKDEAWIQEQLPENINFTLLSDRSLIALQGPSAEKVLCDLLPEHQNIITDQSYMTLSSIAIDGHNLYISRLGYTGEDGFELSIPNAIASDWWNRLLNHDEVQPTGLAARDSLRQEMGYPLYGNDISDKTTPVEANLNWLITKEPTPYIGSDIINTQRQNKPSSKRIGVILDERGVPREGYNILSEDKNIIGTITSGCYSPILKKGIAQGHVLFEHSKKETMVYIDIRGKHIPAHITLMPFIASKTKVTTSKKGDTSNV